jgi:hypothetical protein
MTGALLPGPARLMAWERDLRKEPRARNDGTDHGNFKGRHHRSHAADTHHMTHDAQPHQRIDQLRNPWTVAAPPANSVRRSIRAATGQRRRTPAARHTAP